MHLKRLGRGAGKWIKLAQGGKIHKEGTKVVGNNICGWSFVVTCIKVMKHDGRTCLLNTNVIGKGAPGQQNPTDSILLKME
jgi:hypothetical protein